MALVQASFANSAAYNKKTHAFSKDGWLAIVNQAKCVVEVFDQNLVKMCEFGRDMNGDGSGSGAHIQSHHHDNSPFTAFHTNYHAGSFWNMKEVNIAFSPTENILIIVSDDCMVMFDIDKKQLIDKIDINEGVYGVGFNNDGDRFFVNLYDNIRLYDTHAHNLQLIKSISLPNKSCLYSPVYSNIGILHAISDGVVYRWDKDGNELGNYPTADVNKIVVSHDGQYLVVMDNSKYIILNAVSGELLFERMCQSELKCADFSPDSKFIVIGMGDVCEIIDLEKRVIVCRMKKDMVPNPNHPLCVENDDDDNVDGVKEGDVMCVKYSPDGAFIAVGYVGESCYLWKNGVVDSVLVSEGESCLDFIDISKSGVVVANGLECNVVWKLV